jgi:hypothetical protein
MIHYVTVATETKQYLPYLKKLLPELVILGMDTKWEGFIYKFKLIIEYTKNIDDNDIVCFIDAYDVLPTKKIVNIENKFKKFHEMNTQIKMVIAYEFSENEFSEIFSKNYFGLFNNNRLNSGNYIGYSKDINHILSFILKNNPDMDDDQIELTKYANKFPNDIYIDKEKIFFNVITKSLQYINIDNNNYEYGFLHANGNGFLDIFLYDHHNIKIDLIENIKIHFNNYCDFFKKVNIYSTK